jgi:hypothetical protein
LLAKRVAPHSATEYQNERLHTFSLIALLVILGGLVLSRPLRRPSRRIGEVVSLVAHLAARVAIIVICGVSGVRAIEHGTLLHVALGVLLFVLSASAVVMSAVFVVALVQTARGSPNGADS